MFPGGKIPGEDIIFSWYTIVIALSFGLVIGFRNYMRGPPCISEEKMKKKTAIITGANTGIGLETAKELATRGGRVILACRDEEKGKQAVEDVKMAANVKKGVEFIKLDLASLQSVRDFVKEFKSKYDKLDVLVNNAGVMYHPEQKTTEGIETHFCTNYLGHFLLTHLLLDSMKCAPSGRILNLVCPAYQLADADFSDTLCEEKEYKAAEAFGLSKLALVLFTKQLARQLEGSTITVNFVHPGLCFTDCYRDMPFMKSKIIALTFKPVLWFLMKGPKDGAQTVLHCAIAKEEEGVSGKYYADMRVQEPHEKANDEEAAEKLMGISAQLTGLSLEVDS